MENLSLKLNHESLLNLLRDFYVLTNIRIVVFDKDYHEILSYPNNDCKFCSLIKSITEGKNKCMECDEKSFKRCKDKKELYIYHCHANLIEATSPLIDNGEVIGYLMFGQISDIKDKKELETNLNNQLIKYDIEANDNDVFKIKYRNQEQIQAASKILEACTLYIILKEYVSIQEQTFIQRLNKYIDDHLSDNLSVDNLTDAFNVSKNRLYELTSEYLNIGIAEHIKNIRIEKAKKLLKESSLKVVEISDQVGFNDYNYFCRVFKSKVGISAKKYRANTK